MSKICAHLLDIEGTTTPISFVHEVLFPYARERMPGYLAAREGSQDLKADLAALRAEYDREKPTLDLPDWREKGASGYLDWLMAADRKSPALKSLQGKIWREGYERGHLEGQVFPDVVPALRRWRERGLRTYIYSSGSVLAQKLLFSNSSEGDLAGFLSGYFDTAVGAKLESSSYRSITAQIGLAPGEILFISDLTAELDAARAAGLSVMLSIRPGNAPVEEGRYESLRSFDRL